jgi:hypothetical protein
MNKGQWLLMGATALSFYGVGQIWLVQVSSYPLWAYVGEKEFRAYHLAWWQGIWGVILAPAAPCFWLCADVVVARARRSGVGDMDRLRAPVGTSPRHRDLVESLDGAPRRTERRSGG